MPSIDRFSGLFFGRRWTRAQLEVFQTRRLRALVRHAYDRVPYYRRLFDQAGLKPDDIRALRDIEKIPMTTRGALQSVPECDLIARGFDPRKLVLHRSGGSTGEPFAIRRTVFEDRLLQAYRLVILFRLGLRISDRRVAVVAYSHLKSPLYTKAGILRYEEIHCLLPPEQILSQLRESKPDVLRGFPGTLSFVADLITEADRQSIRPRLITTDSEMLTPATRARISRGFGSRVLDFYDSHEFNMIAWECPSSALYHVSDVSMIAEVISDGRVAGPNEEGELAGTALHSWAMPFIRFRLGDIVTRGPDCCPCGAQNSVLAQVQGRVADRFLLPDGRIIHPEALVNPLRPHPHFIRQYQIVQERCDLIRVKLAPMPGVTPAPEGVAAIRRLMCEKVGPGVLLEVELVSAIPAGQNGKFRPYYSLVGANARESPVPAA